MKTLLRVFGVALISVMLGACVADQSYQSGAAGSVVGPIEEKSEYLLAHVEFDDQGWFHDVRQRQALFEKLEGLRKQSKAMLIVTYTHGWKHNAHENDGNLDEFRKLLKELDGVEKAADKQGGPRKVVGVYIGWRGASTSIPVVENLTFWARKNAAERVGTRSVKQLFIELNQFRVIANKWKWDRELADPHETQLVFVGHSFGGLVTYHALYSEILERGLEVNNDGTYRMAKSFGDFVLLVNPAFEGASYEPIWRAANLRGCYPSGQKPVMAIVTSSADRATKVAFPAGRLYTYFQSAPQDGERETVMNTVGHLERYRTHILEVRPNAQATPRPSPVNAAQLAVTGAQPNAQAMTVIGDFQLRKVESAAPTRMPYLVIQAGQELISDHNDFWNESFRSFSVGFIVSQILTSKEHRDTNQIGAACPHFATETPKPIHSAAAAGGL